LENLKRTRGRARRKEEGNIKAYLKEMGCEERIKSKTDQNFYHKI
jgi:hypothetical protein